MSGKFSFAIIFSFALGPLALAEVGPSLGPTPIEIHPKDLGKWDFLFTQAKEHHESGRHRQAMRTLGQLLAHDPRDTEAWELMALSLRKQALYLRALRIYYYLATKMGDLGKLTLSRDQDVSWPEIQALYGDQSFPQKQEVQYLFDIAMSFYEYGVSSQLPLPETKDYVLELSEKYLELCERLQYRQASIQYLRALLAKSQGKDVSAGHHFYRAYQASLKDPENTQKAQSDYQLLAGHKLSLEGRPELAAHFYRDLMYDEEAHHQSRFIAQRSEQDLRHGGPSFSLGVGVENVDNLHLLEQEDEDEFSSNQRLTRDLQANDSWAKTFEGKAAYLTDPTDEWFARLGMIFKSYNYDQTELQKFDQQSFALSGLVDYELSRYISLTLAGNSGETSGQYYHADILMKDQEHWEVRPGFKWVGDSAIWSLEFPYLHQSSGGELTSDTTSFSARLVYDRLATHEWWSPLLSLDAGTILSGDYAGLGQVYGFNLQNTIRPSDRVRLLPRLRWQETNRDLSTAHERNWSLHTTLQINPIESWERWLLQLSFERARLSWGSELEQTGTRDTWGLGTLVYF